MSRETPLFSVVAVCCNVAAYAEQMILSIRNQTYSNFECLAVVEESSDGTERIVRGAVADDPHFRVVCLPRSGSASVPRNYGIEHARGEYLLFVDGDDWIEPDSLERFASVLAEHPELDLVVSGSRNFRMSPDGVLQFTGTHVAGTPGAHFPTGAAFLDASGFEHRWNTATWMNLYRRKLLMDNRLFQAPGRLHQDDEWVYRVFLKAGPTAVAPFLHYDYRFQPGSVTHVLSSKTIYDRAENFKSVCAFFDSGDYPPELKKKLAIYFCRNFLHVPFLRRRYSSKEIRQLLPREDCRKALLVCLGTREQFRSYCRVVLAARKTSRLFIPLMYLARKKWGFWLAEWSVRLLDGVLSPSCRWLRGLFGGRR
ncbi:MAG: glycosyltransferase [Lentisphaeria bacterium]|nr:glycosyltransferase [Lentisphaeria bacterium]